MDEPQTPELVAPVVDDAAFAAFDAQLDPPRGSVEPPVVVDEPVLEQEPAVAAERNTDGTFKAKEKKPRNDPQARIDEITAKHREAERRADAAERELQALRRPTTVEPPKTAIAPPVTAIADWERYKAMPEAPKLDAFQSYEDWQTALAVFVADARYDERRDSERQAEARTRREAADADRAKGFTERWTAAQAADPEFIKQVDPRLLETPRLSALPLGTKATFGNFLVEQLFDADHPKELALHLSNPETVQRLATLPPETVIRELAKFDASVGTPAASSTGPAVPPPASKAKPVFKPVTGSAQIGDGLTADDSTPIEEFVRVENLKDRRRAS